eukprot:2936691-Ditylum_brightwellii.AAC.2
MHPSHIKKLLKLQRADATLTNAIGNKLEEAVKDSRERPLAVMLMAGADKARQGNDKYPKSVVDTKRYINNYKPDPVVVRVISQAKGVAFVTDGQEQQKKKV